MRLAHPRHVTSRTTDPVMRTAVCTQCLSDELAWEFDDKGVRTITCGGCGAHAAGDAALDAFKVIKVSGEKEKEPNTMAHKRCEAPDCTRMQVRDHLCSIHFKKRHKITIGQAKRAAVEAATCGAALTDEASIPQRMRALRLALNMDKKTFCGICGISDVWLTKIERGYVPQRAALQRICAKLPPDYATYIREGGALPVAAPYTIVDLNPADPSALGVSVLSCDVNDPKNINSLIKIKPLEKSATRRVSTTTDPPADTGQGASGAPLEANSPPCPLRIIEVEYGEDGRDRQTGRTSYLSLRAETNGRDPSVLYAALVAQVRALLDTEVPYLNDLKASLQQECTALAAQKKLLLRQIEGLTYAHDANSKLPT